MAFVAYLFGLVATLAGVFMLYGTLMKPFTAGIHEPVQASVEEKADPATTQSTRNASPGRNEASDARAEADDRGRDARTSRRSPVRSVPDGLRLKPERCWIVTDSTRNYGYYGECR
ncbi:MAG: hypothetical protein AB7O50_07500 [Pseudolabrys sp.]